MSTTTTTVATEADSSFRPKTVHAQLDYFLEPEDGSSAQFFPGTASAYRRKHDSRTVEITDIRGNESEFSLDVQGFQPVKQTCGLEDFTDEEGVKTIVYDETIELLKKTTGATRVYPYSHVVRLQPWAETLAAMVGKADTDTVVNKSPAHFIHVDHSYRGAEDVLRDNVPDEEEAARLKQTRWAVINVWRPFAHAASREPLAMCDARSIDDAQLRGVYAKLPQKGSNGAYQSVSQGDGFEVWHLLHSPQHRWYYLSDMTPGEALLLKIFDSKTTGGVARRSPHSAFSSPHDCGPARKSMEIRCLVFWEDQGDE